MSFKDASELLKLLYNLIIAYTYYYYFFSFSIRIFISEFLQLCSYMKDTESLQLLKVERL